MICKNWATLTPIKETLVQCQWKYGAVPLDRGTGKVKGDPNL